MTKMLEYAIYLGGGIHFAILAASAMAPRVLDWKKHLAPLPAMIRQLFWVYGIFIVLMIVSFGALSFAFAPEMAAGNEAARGIAAVIAVFWGLRLAVQLFVFDAEEFLTTRLRRFGYEMLTVAFTALTAIYGWAATGAGGALFETSRCKA